MTISPNVLYVEDDEYSRQVMQTLLRNRMKLPHVTIYEDSMDFIARVRAIDPLPSIVFLDIHVKPYNGFQMLNMLRQIDLYNGVPIVALTASVMTEEVALLKNSGFDGCLAKPIDIDTFPGILARILDGEMIWRIL